MKLDLTSNRQSRVVEEAIGGRWERSWDIKLTDSFRKTNYPEGCDVGHIGVKRRLLTAENDS